MGFLRRLLGGGDGRERREVARGDVDATGDAAGDGVRIFSGLFAADPAAVERWDIESGLTPPDWPAVEFKHLETVKLGTLESILTGVAYEAIDQDELHDFFRDGGDEGPWVARVRPQLTSALAALDATRLPTVAAAWADTDEFKVDPSDRPAREDIEDLAALLGDMSELARQATATGRPMYLLMSL